MPYISVKEFADKAKVTPDAIYKRIHSGNIKYKKVGKVYLVQSKT